MNNRCLALHAGFFNSAESNPDAAALDFGDHVWNYGELRTLALRIADTIETSAQAIEPSYWIGMLAGKTVHGFASILGILASGKGYLPLSCDYPVNRLADMIQRSGTRFLLVDSEGAKILPELLATFPYPLTICLTVEDNSVFSQLSGSIEFLEQHTLITISPTAKEIHSLNLLVGKEVPAYLLFTSGSTGRPKGVVVAHGNVRFFLDVVSKRYDLNSTDRFSQNFEFTFDLSLFDIFASFDAGGCICPPGAGDKIFPQRYITRKNLTVWFSVPSMIETMRSMRQLNRDVFDGLRYSLFCGEPLMVGAARLWHESAPNAALVNLYGPTEATICCMDYRWEPTKNEHRDECIMPIGEPFRGLTAKVLDEEQLPVEEGRTGELWIGGAQVALGYLDDPAETKKRFVYDEELGVWFYRTGDRVFRDLDSGQLCFVGRVDQQVKVRGYRIELGEVEKALRACSGGTSVIAVPWPPDGLHDKLVAVFGTGSLEAVNQERLLSDIRRHLPSYMVPATVVCVEKLPLNANGKIDRRATLNILLEKGGPSC